MKLFNAIAAAAVIGTSITTATAEAGNGWTCWYINKETRFMSDRFRMEIWLPTRRPLMATKIDILQTVLHGMP